MFSRPSATRALAALALTVAAATAVSGAPAHAGLTDVVVTRQVAVKLTDAEQREVDAELQRLVDSADKAGLKQMDFAYDALGRTTQAAFDEGFDLLGVEVKPEALDCTVDIWPPYAACCIGLSCCSIDFDNGPMCYTACSDD